MTIAPTNELGDDFERIDAAQLEEMYALDAVEGPGTGLDVLKSYSVIYDAAGNVATSTTVDYVNLTTRVTDYDKDGNPTPRVIRTRDWEERYDEKGGLSYISVYGDGLVMGEWLDGKGTVLKSVDIDAAANTFDLTLNQNGRYGPITKTSAYRGAEGWVGYPLSAVGGNGQ